MILAGLVNLLLDNLEGGAGSPKTTDPGEDGSLTPFGEEGGSMRSAALNRRTRKAAPRGG